MQQTPQGSLAERVQAFAEDKKKLEDGVADLEMQLSRLATLRKDVEGVSANFDRALDLVSSSAAGDAEGRLAELSQFVKATQARLDEIERSMATVGQLQVRLGDLQSRLVPLEASDGGVADLIAQGRGDPRPSGRQDRKHRSRRERRPRHAGEQRSSRPRRNSKAALRPSPSIFPSWRRIRSDIAGLFDKLSNAADTSSN